jgi:hypothetical protein
MNLKMKKVAAAFAMAGFSAVASAAGGIGTVTEITITGGSFGMGAPAPANCAQVSGFENYNCVTAGTANPIDADDGLFEGPTLTAFNFFNAPVTTFTAASATGAADSTSGNPLEGTTTASTISLDLGSFYASWSGSNFLQAPSHQGAGATTSNPVGVNDNPIVTGTYDSTTGAFNISWSAYITTAPFGNQTGYWNLDGVATAVGVVEPPVGVVPEASTYGMMLAGLGLVGFAVRRRRTA